MGSSHCILLDRYGETVATHRGRCKMAGEATSVGGGWVHYPFLSLEDDQSTKRRLGPKQIKSGTHMPRNMRNLCFELKGLTTRRVIDGFYLEQAGQEYILAISFLVPGVTVDSVKSNAHTVARLIAQHTQD